ncbi:MAG: hypothetical protein ACXWH1_14985 [Thermoanaerobaculia bacterium]
MKRFTAVLVMSLMVVFAVNAAFAGGSTAPKPQQPTVNKPVPVPVPPSRCGDTSGGLRGGIPPVDCSEIKGVPPPGPMPREKRLCVLGICYTMRF